MNYDNANEEPNYISAKLDNIQKSIEEIKTTIEKNETSNNSEHDDFTHRIGKLEIGFGKMQIWTSGAIFVGGIIVGLVIPKLI